MKVDDFDREAVWVTPDPSRMPHCKVCKAQGCMHFRRGFAHLLALNPDCGIPTLSADKGPGEEQGQTFDADILIPTACPCHGCNELVVRADLNRGHDKSLSYNLDQKTGEWKAEFVRYRYKRDTELVVGCAGRHKIIESPKAGRYAQLWCRTCCNCSISSIGNLVGCTNTAHWHTVTNRSYHEKTPFHQQAHSMLQDSYCDALQARIPFEDAIGITGQTYYKLTADKGGDFHDAPLGASHSMKSAQGGNVVRNVKRERGGEGVDDMPQMSSGGSTHAVFPHHGLMDPHMLRGINSLNGINGINGMMGGNHTPQGHLQQLQALQPAFWPHGMDLSSSGSNTGLNMMLEARAMSERVQKPRTNGAAATKPGGGMLQAHMPLRSVMSQGINGMMPGGKGPHGHRGDGLMQAAGMSFGIDAYSAFRGMFEGGAGPMGMNVGAGLSGAGLHGYSVGMRGPPLGLAGIGSDLVARFHQSHAPPAESADMRQPVTQPDPAPPSKSAYYDLENVPDILTNGGRV